MGVCFVLVWFFFHVVSRCRTRVRCATCCGPILTIDADGESALAAPVTHLDKVVFFFFFLSFFLGVLF
jgi:hypothetical protein